MKGERLRRPDSQVQIPDRPQEMERRE
jgi:hypothetical protein